MRDFLKDILQNQHILTGIPHGLTQSETTVRIDRMLVEANKFGKLSEDQKKKIIENSMLSDKKFYGLTPAKVKQYLSDYWEQLDSATKHHLLREPDELPKKWEPCDPDKAQEYIDRLKKRFTETNYDHLQPIKNQVRILKKEHEAVKVLLKEIDCPGHIENNQRVACKSPEYCNGCNGYGKVKVTV